jgi:hypothetical protein
MCRRGEAHGITLATAAVQRGVCYPTWCVSFVQCTHRSLQLCTYTHADSTSNQPIDRMAVQTNWQFFSFTYICNSFKMLSMLSLQHSDVSISNFRSLGKSGKIICFFVYMAGNIRSCKNPRILVELWVVRINHSTIYLLNIGSEDLTKNSDRNGLNMRGLSRAIAFMQFSTTYCTSLLNRYVYGCYLWKSRIYGYDRTYSSKCV